MLLHAALRRHSAGCTVAGAAGCRGREFNVSHPSLTPSLSAADVLPKTAYLYPHDAYSCFAPITFAPIKLNSNKHAQRIGSLAECGDSVHLAVAF